MHRLFRGCTQIFEKLFLVFTLVFQDCLSRLLPAQRLFARLCKRSCRQTERRSHRGRRPGVYLADVPCLLVERIHLRTHELGLNLDDVFHILGLAEFL